MSDNTTIRMIRAYQQEAGTTMFLTGLFQAPPQNFHSSEEVEIDIERGNEEIAIVITDLSTGYRYNSADLYTNKKFKPPILKESSALNSFDMIKRQLGQNPFESPNFRANVIEQMFKIMRKLENKVRRTIELQASQVLQTGTITLVDENGTSLYVIDFKPKVTHFVDAGTAWNAASPDISGDIISLANVVRNDGLADPDQLIMGETAWEDAIKDDDFKARFDTRRITLGELASRPAGMGATFRGVANIGNYEYQIWTYSGRYINPDGGAKTQFISPSNVVLRSSMGRMDATFGAIPNIGRDLGVMPNLVPELPQRLQANGVDLFTNVWMSADGEQLFGGVGSRPLLIPTGIDTYGRINTRP